MNEIASLQLASTGHQHEGSVYGARKDYDLARMQVNLVAHQMTALREALNSPNLPSPHPEELLDSDDDDQDNNANTNGKTNQLNNGFHDDQHTNGSNGALGITTNGTTDGDLISERLNGHSRDGAGGDSNNMMDVNGSN